VIKGPGDGLPVVSVNVGDAAGAGRGDPVRGGGLSRTVGTDAARAELITALADQTA
jgi:hypothetical protein